MVLSQFTYVFAIGTFFALLEAYNNGASMLNPPSVLRDLPADPNYRRCCQRLGDQCVLPLRHVPAGDGTLPHL